MVKYFSSGPQFVRETLKWKMPDGALMPEKSVLVGCQNRRRYMQDQPTQSGQLKLGSCPKWFHGFHGFSRYFHGFWLVSMVFQGSFMIFHGFWLVSMVFHGSRLVCHGSRLVFHVFLLVLMVSR